MKASFDTWTIVFLLAASQGFFIAWILWHWKRGNKKGNRLLAVLITLFSISMLEYVMYWTNYIYYWPGISNISINFTFLYGSLIWLYLRTIYEDIPVTWKDAWHLIPFFLANIPFYPWYFAAFEIKQQSIAGQVQFPWNARGLEIQFWARMIHLLVFLIWNYWYVYQQPKVGETTRWAKLICLFHLLFCLAYIAYFALVKLPFFNTLWDYHISAVMTAMIYLIAYSGYVQPQVFDGYRFNETGLASKYKNSGLTPEASRTLLRNLELLMREEKVYQDTEISLEKLANLLNASKHHVSQVINEHIGASFFEYINGLRIEEAKQMLSETSRTDLHVIEVAYAVGFNNKVSFNSAFKRATGITPTEYRKSHGESDSAAQQPRASS
jgi:AraC-like DNA-binding protein